MHDAVTERCQIPAQSVTERCIRPLFYILCSVILIFSNNRTPPGDFGMGTIRHLIQGRNPGDDDEAFLRALVVPEEDRRQFTAAPWRGEFRWFRSPNVVPIERWRLRKGSGGDE